MNNEMISVGERAVSFKASEVGNSFVLFIAHKCQRPLSNASNEDTLFCIHLRSFGSDKLCSPSMIWQCSEVFLWCQECLVFSAFIMFSEVWACAHLACPVMFWTQLIQSIFECHVPSVLETSCLLWSKLREILCVKNNNLSSLILWESRCQVCHYCSASDDWFEQGGTLVICIIIYEFGLLLIE